ncbi:hypothetical protein Tco_0817944 [Tanacetum coccineum]
MLGSLSIGFIAVASIWWWWHGDLIWPVAAGGDGMATWPVAAALPDIPLGNTVGLTLWNEMEMEFHMRAHEAMAKPVVIAGSSCWVTNNGLQLSGSSATHYYLHPNIPETYQIQQAQAQMADAPPLLNIESQRYEESEQEKTRNRFPLSTLLEIDPQNYQINTVQPWYYQKCSTYGQKVIQEHPMAKCKNHEPQPTALYSTAKRPDFILDTVFKQTALPLPAPSQAQTLQQPPAEITETTTVETTQTVPTDTGTTVTELPKHTQLIPLTPTADLPESTVTQPSTPPKERQTDLVQKESGTTKVPKALIRKALFQQETTADEVKPPKK